MDKDFGNALIPGEIHGSVFRDDDSDGIWDAGEPALEDWEVFLDDDDDGRWDSGETKTVTDEDGLYSFKQAHPTLDVNLLRNTPKLYSRHICRNQQPKHFIVILNH